MHEKKCTMCIGYPMWYTYLCYVSLMYMSWMCSKVFMFITFQRWYLVKCFCHLFRCTAIMAYKFWPQVRSLQHVYVCILDAIQANKSGRLTESNRMKQLNKIALKCIELNTIRMQKWQRKEYSMCTKHLKRNEINHGSRMRFSLFLCVCAPQFVSFVSFTLCFLPCGRYCSAWHRTVAALFFGITFA